MAIAQQNINSEDDFLKVGPDATATFDRSPSNPTERAGSENLGTLDSDEDDLDEDFDDEDEDDEEDDDEEEEIDDDEEEEDVEADDHDLAKGPRAPSAYRKS